MIIYLITNTITKKKYVGMTAGTASRRFKDHCRQARLLPKVPLHLSIAKYGPEAFTVEVIANARDRGDLCKLERSLIKKHKCLAPNGYNLTTGGDGYSGGKASTKTRDLLSQRAREAWARLTPEQREQRGINISRAKKGKRQPWATGDHLRVQRRLTAMRRAGVALDVFAAASAAALVVLAVLVALGVVTAN